MSIWSRSHNDLARLAKALKDRNAQTRQGLAERGRPTNPAELLHPGATSRSENCVTEGPSRHSSQPLDLTISPKTQLVRASCDKQLNLSDSCILNSVVERGRVDSFSSADSAISPDFHVSAQSPLSPILKKPENSNEICLRENDLLTPNRRNSSASSNFRDKKVTFIQEDEGVPTALLAHQKVGKTTDTIEFHDGNFDNISTIKFDDKSLPATEDFSLAHDVRILQEPDVFANEFDQSKKTLHDTKVVVSSSSISQQTEVVANGTTTGLPISHDADLDLTGLTATANAAHQPQVRLDSSTSSSHEGGHESLINRSAPEAQDGGVEEFGNNSLKLKCVHNQSLGEKGEKNVPSDANVFTSQDNSLQGISDSLASPGLPPRSCQHTNVTSHMLLGDPSNVANDKKTICDASLNANNSPPSPVLLSPIPPEPENEGGLVSESSLSLSNELHTLLISVLADHKRQNLHREEVLHLDKSENINLPDLDVPNPETVFTSNETVLSGSTSTRQNSNYLPKIDIEDASNTKNTETVETKFYLNSSCLVGSFEQNDENHGANDNAQVMGLFGENCNLNGQIQNFRGTISEKPIVSVSKIVTSTTDSTSVHGGIIQSAVPMTPTTATTDDCWAYSSMLHQAHDYEFAVDTDRKNTPVVSSVYSNAPKSDERFISTNVACEIPPPLEPALDGESNTKTTYVFGNPWPHSKSFRDFSRGFGSNHFSNYYLKGSRFSNSVLRFREPQTSVPSVLNESSLCKGLWNSRLSLQNLNGLQSHPEYTGMITSLVPRRTTLFPSTLLSLNSSHNKKPLLIWSLQQSFPSRSRLDFVQPESLRSFSSTIGQSVSIKPALYESSLNVTAHHRGDNSNHCYSTPLYFNSSFSFIPPGPPKSMLSFGKTKASGSSVHSDKSLSLDDDLSTEVSEVNTDFETDDIDCAEDIQKEWSQSLASKPGLLSAPKINAFNCVGNLANAETSSKRTVNEYQEEDYQFQSAEEASDFHDMAGVFDKENTNTISECLSLSQLPLDANIWSQCNEEGLPNNCNRQSENHFVDAGRSYEAKKVKKYPREELSHHASSEIVKHDSEKEETPKRSHSKTQTRDSYSQWEDHTNQRNTFSKPADALLSPHGKDHDSVFTDSSSTQTGKSDESLLDLPLHTPSSKSKSRSASFRARMDRINNVSKLLLAQFPVGSKSPAGTRGQAHLPLADESLVPTLEQGRHARKNSPSLPLDNSTSSQAHSSPLLPTKSSISPHENVSPGAISDVLLKILQTVQFLSGHTGQSDSQRSNSDKCIHSIRRLSVTTREVKEMLKQLKDARNVLSQTPAPGFQAVRDDLQKLSLALKQQLRRSKANLEHDLQHRNSTFQCCSLNKDCQRLSEISFDKGGTATQKSAASHRIHAPPRTKKRHTKTNNLPEKAEKGSKINRTNLEINEIFSRNNSFVSPHRNPSNVKIPGAVVGHGEELTKNVLDGHNLEKNCLNHQSPSAEDFKSLQSESKAKINHQDNHIDPNPFKEMYKFMCEEMNISNCGDGGSASDASVLTNYISNIDTAIDSSLAHERTGLHTKKTTTLSEWDRHLSSTHSQQQHQQHRQQQHPEDTDSEQICSTSSNLHDLNRTFCLQEFPKALRVKASEPLEGKPSLLEAEEVYRETEQPGVDQVHQFRLSADVLETGATLSALDDTSLHRNLHQTQPCPVEDRPHLSPSSMESDSDLTFQLDRDFDKHLADMKPHVLKLPQKTERQKSAVWIKKLCEPAGSSITARQNRNMYAKLMLHMLKKGSLHSPFDQRPSDGPLQPLPSYMSIYFDDPLTDISPQAERLPDWVEGELGESHGTSGVLRSLGNPAATSTWVSSRERPHSSMGHTLDKDPSLSPIRNTDLGRSRGYSA
ncbi:centrosomal protein of 112 kDa-like, partial [Elysia marginata]